MHIEPGVVDGAKLALGAATGVGSIFYVGNTIYQEAKSQGVVPVGMRAVVASVLVLCFFEVLPHFSMGVSEVHFIFGATLFLFFGAGPAGVGLALGLIAQGVFFAPFDLPQLGMNLTTLLVPLVGIQALASQLIAPQTRYVDLSYQQVLTLAAAYHAGVVAWVAFWVLYGQGVSETTLVALLQFGTAYLGLIVCEPVIDLGLLAFAKSVDASAEAPNDLSTAPTPSTSWLVSPRLFAHASA